MMVSAVTVQSNSKVKRGEPYVPDPGFDPASLTEGILLADSESPTLEATNKIASLVNQYNGSKPLVKETDARRPTIVIDDVQSKNAALFTTAADEVLKIDSHYGSSYTSFAGFWVFKEGGSNLNMELIGVPNVTAGGFLIRKTSTENTYSVRIGYGSSFAESTFTLVTDNNNYHVLFVQFQTNGAGTSRLIVELDGLPKVDVSNYNAMASGHTQSYREGNVALNTTGPQISIAWRCLVARVLTPEEKAGVYSFVYANYLPIALQTMSYSSSIDAISNLKMKIAWKPTVANAPVCVLMHGYNENIDNVSDAAMKRFAGYNFFAVAVGMRGRNSASGSKDTSAREIHDIYDAIVRVRTLTNRASNNRCLIDGVSGGGGNVYAFVSKFPDVCVLAVSFFGINDYGYDATFGWWQTSPTYRTDIEAGVGGSPASLPNEYKSRQHYESVKNFVGKLRMYHDSEDVVVPISQTTRMATKLTNEGWTNYVMNLSNASSPNRWEHGGFDGVIPAESDFVGEVATLPLPSLPLSGTLVINGFIKTAKFTIWLGNGTSALNGTNRRATLVYNYSTNSYTITPSLDSPATDMTYTFLDDVGRASSGTISSATPFTPS